MSLHFFPSIASIASNSYRNCQYNISFMFRFLNLEDYRIKLQKFCSVHIKNILVEVLFAKVVFEQKIIFQGVSNQVSEEQEQVPLKICRGKDDITTFFKVGKEHFDS